MVDRMHVPKVWQMEKVGWYRENSVRFVRLTNWRPMATGIGMLFLVPVAVWNLMAYSKVPPSPWKCRSFFFALLVPVLRPPSFPPP